MCLAIPMRIVSVEGPDAVVELDGLLRTARLDLLPGAGVGDYVLVHAGIAIAKVDPDEAENTLRLARELGYEVR